MQNFIPAQTGLNHETELLIKQSREGALGVDLPNVKEFKLKTGQKSREKIGLAQVNEPQVIRHFVRLSNQNFILISKTTPRLGPGRIRSLSRYLLKIAV